jgi:competence protein ComEC
MERAQNILSDLVSKTRVGLKDRHAPVFVFIWSFVCGIVVSSIVHTSPLWSILIFVIAVGIFIGEKILNKIVPKVILLLVISLFSFGLGILRFDIKDFHQADTNIESQVGSKVSLAGIVVSEPEIREKNMRFVVLIPNVNEKVLASTNLYSDIKYGDKINFSGKLEKPGVIESDPSVGSGQSAGRPFDYGAYLSKDDIYYTMGFAQIDLISRNNGNPIISFLLKVKESFVNKMKNVFQEPQASLLAGLLVSGKQALPVSVLDEFKRAGVVHIVVLSGYNIMVVAEFFRRILGFLSLRIASSVSILGIVLFVLMTGATATVVRAAIMALIAVSGKMFGRGYSVHRALLVAGFLMLIQNPKILIFDPSFQLSMLATIAMIYVSPIVERYLTRVSDKWGMKQILSATISTQIFVLPFLLYSMGNISIVSLFSNILILAFVPYTMLVGFIATILAYINTILALPFTYVSHLMLSWILGVAHILGNLSWASLNVSSFSIWAMILVYIIYVFGLIFLSKQEKTKLPF